MTEQSAGAAQQWLLELCHRHRLSPTQRRVAHSFVDTLPDAAFLSTSEAAARAGVSQATVTRFAAAMGFSTYADFRGALRRRILAGPELGEERPAVDPVAGVHETLTTAAATLASPAMRAAVADLARAEVLGILGLRASAALASYAGYFARRVVDDVRVLTSADEAPDALVQMSQAGPSSGASSAALVVVAMPRYPAATVRALRLARSLGITTVLVVDTPLVDFAGDADHVLVAPADSELVFDTHAAPLVVLSALLDGVAGAHPRRTQARLEAHEALVESWMHPDPE